MSYLDLAPASLVVIPFRSGTKFRLVPDRVCVIGVAAGSGGDEFLLRVEQNTGYAVTADGSIRGDPGISATAGAITFARFVYNETIARWDVVASSGGSQTDVSGNAGTATALQTARTINGVSFDGTANIEAADVLCSVAVGVTSTVAAGYSRVLVGPFTLDGTFTLDGAGAIM
jgi:hypothetical protein